MIKPYIINHIQYLTESSIKYEPISYMNETFAFFPIGKPLFTHYSPTIFITLW